MHHVLSTDGVVLQPHTPLSTHVGADRTLLVHRVHDPRGNTSAVDQLLVHARSTVPAVLNYLYFGAANIAVVYFGKTIEGNKKRGIDGADDMKIKMIRFLTTEIWPPLLRTDVPDESLVSTEVESPHVRKHDDASHKSPPTASFTPPGASLSPLVAGSATDGEVSRQQGQRQQWFVKSLESGMQVLVYLKPGVDGTKYLKLILANTMRRIHFDIIDSREEKYRWDNRMLHIRMLDNLETQKAISSYETYEQYFREACECSLKHNTVLETPDQPLVSVVYNDANRVCSLEPHATLRSTEKRRLVLPPARTHYSSASTPPPPSDSHPPPPAASPAGNSSTALPISPPLASARCVTPTAVASSPASCTPISSSKLRSYKWFENLEKPESLTLDYKSYFTNPAREIQERAVKFMCGFLNGIGQGKLVIGVHEMDRTKTLESNGSFPSQRQVSQQQSLVDVSLAETPTATQPIITHNMLVDQLVVGVSITDQEISDLQLDLSEQLQQCVPPIPPQAVQIEVIPVVLPEKIASPANMLLLYDTNAAGWRDQFRQKSNNAIRQLRKKGLSLCPVEYSSKECLHAHMPEVANELPHNVAGWQVYAVVAFCDSGKEIEDDEAWRTEIMRVLDNASRNRSVHKLFRVDQLELPELRIIEISVDIARCGPPLSKYRGKFFNGWPSIPIWNPLGETITRVDRNYNIFSHQNQGVSTIQELLPTRRSQWYRNAAVVGTIYSFSCGMHYPRSSKSRKLRLVHPSFNTAFLQKLGLPLVEMLQTTPVGIPGFVVSRPVVSLLQTSLKVSGLSFMPLLMSHIYELLGSLPSPYPYVAVPIALQSARVHPALIPLFMYNDYEMMTLRPAVVIDSTDGYLKVLRWCGGSCQIEAILGIGFGRITRQDIECRAQSMNSTKKLLTRTRSLRSISLKADPPEALSPQTNRSSHSAISTFQDPCDMFSVRRREANVPLIRFSFLYGSRDKLHHGKPWTLQTLLKWLHVAAHDTHVRPFGYCDRSFGFYAEFGREMCTLHIGEEDDSFADDSGCASPTTPFSRQGTGSQEESAPPTCCETPHSYYPASFDCTLCRLMGEWNNVKL